MIKALLRKLRHGFIWAKFMATRTSSYVTFANFGMLGLLFLAKLKDAGILNIDLGNTTPFFILGFLIFLIIIGACEIYLIKGYENEINIVNNETPLHPKLQGIQEKVEWLYNQKMAELKGGKNEENKEDIKESDK